MDSDLSNIDPHPTAKFAAIILGGASLVSALIGGLIYFLRDGSFDINPFDLPIENPLILLISTPLIMTPLAYVLTYCLCWVLQLIFAKLGRKGDK